MKKVSIVLVLDVIIIIMISLFYSRYLSKLDLGGQYVGLAGFALLTISLSLNCLTYVFGLIFIYVFKSKLEFIYQVFIIKLAFSFILLLFLFVTKSYDVQLRDTIFLIVSLLSGAILLISLKFILSNYSR